MTTPQTFAQLYGQRGAFVHDMHDGVGPLAQRFDVIQHVRWETDDLWHGQERSKALQGSNFDGFGNKELRVVGVGEAVTPSGRVDTIVCGYHYDSRWAGIVVLGPKES